MKKLVLPLNIIFLGLSLACDTALIITHLYPIKITASVFFMLAAAVNLIYALKLPRYETAVSNTDRRRILRNERRYSDKLKFHRRSGDFCIRSYLLFHSIFADAKAPSDRLYPRNYNIYPHSAVYDVLTAS